jgi:hypothetical protein
MKRKLFSLSVFVAFIVVAAILTSLRKRDTHFPHFVAGAPSSIPPIRSIDYDWLTDAPFENDQLWCWTMTSIGPRTFRMHAYLYDLKSRAILGELFDGTYAGIHSRDGSRILVRNSEMKMSFQQQVSDIIAKLFGRAGGGRGNRSETFWVLDISRNVATKVGHFSQIQGTGSVWHSSPDFRHGYNMPSSGNALFVCDLDNFSMTRFEVKGYPRGWWDDHRIVLESREEQFTLFDIQTEKTIPLFNYAEVQPILARVGVTNMPDLSADAHWNGTNYDFYFGLNNKLRGLQGDSFLLKANRSGPPLTMVSTNFAFRWGGSFRGDLYLFQGESGAPGRGGNGGIYLRNLIDGTEKTILPPDNKGQYSIPRFYGNEVIYLRDRLLHRIALDGSNDSLVLTNVQAATKSSR